MRPDWREIGLWSAAGFVVIGIHAGAAWFIQNNQPVEPASDIATAVIIDMEPLPAPIVAQPVREEVPIEPEPMKPEPVQQEAAAPAPVEEVQPEPEQQIQPIEEVTPDQPEPDIAEEVTPEPEEAEPLDEQAEELVELPKVEVPLPVVRPVPEKPDVPKKRVDKVVRKPVTKPAPATVKDETPREAKQQPIAARAVSVAATQKWNARLNAHLARYKRTVRIRGSGKIPLSVRISIARDGAVASATIAMSSGNPEYDKAAISMVQRASPLPAPPEGMNKNELVRVLPFNF
ncbi:TonB family protein [Phyllobacterium zundukense]|uniref:TonB family protein n=1 Tax=Phyllobacterium zundukense TaxID=1867719 RepID=UPI000C1BE70D|nr:TonB family protein [Phyllobacterium zundukense]ATU95709.1 hypothetical protein BLM14_28775 [Phyllobacterium zundukense]